MKGSYIILISLLISITNFSQILYWQEIGNFRSIYDIDLIGEDTLYIVGVDNDNNRNIFITTDYGTTWSMKDDFPYNYYETALLYDENSSMLYCFGYSPYMYKSSDLGATWTERYTGTYDVKFTVLSKEGYIFIGNVYGDLSYSNNLGSSWLHYQLNDVGGVNDIAIDTSDIVYVVSNQGGLMCSSDFGTNWIQCIDSVYINSLEIDDNQTFYLSDYFDIFITDDLQANWTSLSYPEYEPGGIQVDNNGNIYAVELLSKGLWRRSEPDGWQKISNFRVDKVFVINPGLILTSVGGSLLLYDSAAIPDLGENYLPLTLDNIWEQMCLNSSSPDPIWNYELKYLQVRRDTLVDSIKYYKINGFSDNWIRYDDSLITIFIYANNTDNVYIDFSKFDGEKYYSYSPYYPSINEVEAISSTEQFLGEEIYCKGIFTHDFSSSTSTLFAENYGFFVTEGSGSGGGGISSHKNKTIQLIITDSLGSTINYPHNYYPEFLITPLTVIGNENFRIDFEVDHEYTRFGYYLYMPDEGVNYIDSVIMEYFYQFGNNLTKPDTILAQNTHLTRDYSVELTLDTTLMNLGYKFKYRLTATEIGILPKSTTVPDTGYFTCIYDNTVDVKEEANLPQEFVLYQNYPNPFNPATKIKYAVPASAVGNENFRSVQLKIYDILGNEIATLVNEPKAPGTYEVEFSPASIGRELSSGIYFYRLESGSYSEVRKMLLLK